MSMIRSFALVVLSVLTFQSVSHAETPAGKQEGHLVLTEVNNNNMYVSEEFVGSNLHPTNLLMANSLQIVNHRRLDDTEVDCLARNIYYESRGEPEEGKVAVGLVTINRMVDERFPSTVCGVVNQRTRTVCQFSWRCRTVQPPRFDDRAWLDCVRIARSLLYVPDSYEHLRRKYNGAIYFHESSIRPSWARKKVQLAVVGGHIFYRDHLSYT